MQNHPKPPRPPPLSVSSTTTTTATNNYNNNHPPQPKPKLRPEPDESPESPLRTDDSRNNMTAIVPAEKYYSPLTSPAPPTPPPHQIVNLNRKEEPPAATSGVVLGDVGGERKGKVGRGEKRGSGGGGGGIGVSFGGVKDIVRKSKKEDLLQKLNLGIRVYQIIFCLISFSVMAADRTQGWSGDSFDRYKEYRFCLSVTILGFIYSAFQAYDVGSHLVTGKHVIAHHLRYQFDFIMDQILAYLLISASSAAASRIDDWQANWGKDEFTEKASASVSMAFLAFLGYAMSSLITGYNLCNRDLP